MRSLVLLVLLAGGCANMHTYSMQAVPIGSPQPARPGDARVTIWAERYQDAVGRYDEVGRACFSEWMAASPPSLREPKLREQIEAEGRTLGADVAIVVDRWQIGSAAGISISFMEARSEPAH